MIIALGAFAVGFNAFCAKYLPLLEGVLLLFEIIGKNHSHSRAGGVR